MTWMGVEPSGRSWPNPERPVWGNQRQQADIFSSPIIVAMHGMASSIVLGPSCPGEYETGPIGDHQCGLALTHNRRCSSLSQTCLLIRRALQERGIMPTFVTSVGYRPQQKVGGAASVRTSGEGCRAGLRVRARHCQSDRERQPLRWAHLNQAMRRSVTPSNPASNT